MKTVFIICKTKIKCVAGIPLFSRQMLFSHATCRQQRQKKLRCLLDNFGQIIPTSECCVNYCCFSHDFGQKYAGDNKQMISQRQHFVVYKYAVYISFFLSLVKGVLQASMQKANVGGTSANGRGDGRVSVFPYILSFGKIQTCKNKADSSRPYFRTCVRT